MLGRVFRYQGWLWRALNTLTDILALSVLWLLCSIPVLTLGAATTALYDSVVRCIRYKQPKPYARFFRTFKNELIPGILLTLMWGAVISTRITVEGRCPTARVSAVLFSAPKPSSQRERIGNTQHAAPSGSTSAT